MVPTLRYTVGFSPPVSFRENVANTTKTTVATAKTPWWVACEQQTVPSADHFFAATTDDVAGLAVAWAVAQAASRPTVKR